LTTLRLRTAVVGFLERLVDGHDVGTRVGQRHFAADGRVLRRDVDRRSVLVQVRGGALRGRRGRTAANAPAARCPGPLGSIDDVVGGRPPLTTATATAATTADARVAATYRRSGPPAGHHVRAAGILSPALGPDGVRHVARRRPRTPFDPLSVHVRRGVGHVRDYSRVVQFHRCLSA